MARVPGAGTHEGEHAAPGLLGCPQIEHEDWKRRHSENEICKISSPSPRLSSRISVSSTVLRTSKGSYCKFLLFRADLPSHELQNSREVGRKKALHKNSGSQPAVLFGQEPGFGATQLGQ